MTLNSIRSFALVALFGLFSSFGFSQSPGDIHEPLPDFRGRTWLMGGSEARRAPVATRAEACEMAKRDMEETISLNARSSRDRGVEERSDCACRYSSMRKTWICRTWFLPVGHTAQSANTK